MRCVVFCLFLSACSDDCYKSVADRFVDTCVQACGDRGVAEAAYSNPSIGRATCSCEPPCEE